MSINKAPTSDTSSIIFQSGFTNFAEVGLTGNNEFQIRTSPGGKIWNTALRANSTNNTLQTNWINSGLVYVTMDTTHDLVPPEASGMLAILMHKDAYPQVPHSAIIAFDAGATPSVHVISIGSKTNTSHNEVLTGTTGADSYTKIAVNNVQITIENHHSTDATYKYFFFC